ncbi:MAG TPA: VWA domain-containing protein [Thermoanaerobaculia bacterium]|jgi:VWFA-related protein|nr:VWA domain-containing protein [Thermoanaerobaculia bacterium]
MRQTFARTLTRLACAAALLLLATPALAAPLPARHQQFLEETELLMSPAERTAFLALREDYQRDAFITAFWRARDPYPDTARNELHESWQAKIDQARELFETLADVRSRFLLLNGPPAARIEISQRDKSHGEGFRCTGIVVPAEVWSYVKDNPTHDEMVVVFYRPGGMMAWRRWDDGDGVEALLVPVSAMTQTGSGDEIYRLIVDTCGEPGQALVAAIRWIGAQPGFKYLLQMLAAETPPPPPKGEWLPTFGAYSTDLQPGAPTFGAELSLAFPGRRQSRTLVQGTILVPVGELAVADVAGARSYDLLLTGEVLRGDELFDRFRYEFHLPPATVGSEQVPLVFERLLRPGDYRLVLKLEDVGGKRFFRTDRPLAVPKVEGTVPPPPPSDPLTARLLAEANALIATGDATVRLLPPVGRSALADEAVTGGQTVLGGKVRFDALVTGDQVASVVFALGGEPVLTKRAPPWSVELDLGHLPRSQRLRATAFDAAGRALASDELMINASAHRFAVTILDPPPKQHFAASVRVAAKVEVPEGQQVERLELYRNETLVATLHQPPWEQPILLPAGEQLTYLRALAYLPDGASTEDHVFVNAPPGLEEVAVQLVELYTSVTDRNGRPAEGLDAKSFAVKEDGAPQQLVRFEQVRDLPISVGVLLDTSASMEPNIEEAQPAALEFFTDIVTPKDRAALVTFNDRPRLRVKFTNELLALGGGLAGLKAERGTALYDSVVFALYYFNGLKGQRALIVLSDGKDESSKLDLEETLEFARGAGVAIYTIGLGKELERDARKALEKLAEETGGRSFFVDEAKQLSPIYQSIQEELRSQYLLVYQSTNAKPDKKFRSVEVKVKELGLEAHTVRGYYP